jgi:hypothetical protein
MSLGKQPNWTGDAVGTASRILLVILLLFVLVLLLTRQDSFDALPLLILQI